MSSNNSTKRQMLLNTLLWKVRLVTVEIVAELLYPDSKNGLVLAKRDIKALMDGGYLKCQKFLLQTLPGVIAPIYSSYPENPPPDYYKLEYFVRQRWDKPPKLTKIYTATHKAARQLGGKLMKGGLADPLMLNHDFLLSQAYLTYPIKIRELWVGEMIFQDADSGFGRKICDAKIICDDRLMKIVESIGAYDARRIKQFCEYFGDYPYDLF